MNNWQNVDSCYATDKARAWLVRPIALLGGGSFACRPHRQRFSCRAGLASQRQPLIASQVTKDAELISSIDSNRRPRLT